MVSIIILGGIAVAITANNDLNGMIAIGSIYTCASGVITGTLSNKPTSLSNAFVMKIVQCPAGLYIAQIIIENSKSDIYIRQCNGNVNSWTSWRKIAFIE